MVLQVQAELLARGISVAALVAHDIDNRRVAPELVAYRQRTAQRLAAHWKNRSVSSHPALAGYRALHEEFGAGEEIPSAEKLLTYVRRHRDFISSNALVDCYNLVSARTLLSIGAHDRERLALPVALRRCRAEDSFVPLGGGEVQRPIGEYGYVDEAGNIVCRLDVLQGEQSRTTLETRQAVLFVQGNRELACADLLRGCWLLAEVIERFCGGRVELVAFFAAAGAGARGGSAQGGRPAEPAAGGRNLLPEVDLATFQGLQLRKGTLLQAEAVAGLPSLVTVTVRCAGEVRALAVSSILTAPAAGGAEQAGASARTGVPSATAAGQSVVLVGPLHPLQLGGTSYDHLLLTLGEGSASRLARLAAPLPDGARLY